MDKLQRINNKIKKPPPDLDRVSLAEVYIVEKGCRIKRICGCFLRELPREYVCENEAGKGTYHEGVGMCYIHEGHSEKYQSYWEHLNALLNVPKNMQELYERSAGLTKEELLSSTNLLRRITVLYWDILDNPEDFKDKDKKQPQLSRWQRSELRRLEELVIKAIDSERKSEGQGLMKGVVVTNFIRGIYDIMFKYLNKNDAQLIINAISKMTHSHHEEGKIRGDLSNLDKDIIQIEEAHDSRLTEVDNDNIKKVEVGVETEEANLKE